MNSFENLIPPDGGWGWMIVIGACLINISTRSIEPSFGLIFADLLDELHVGTTGAAVIMSTLDGMINFSGIIVGPLVKSMSTRKVAVLGAFISSVALISTSFARSITHIVLTYGILGGVGFGLATASSFVALNDYFVKKRGQAVGLAMAGTALGFMAMPQIVSALLRHYDFQGCLLIIGGISLHGFLGASLYEPVRRHMKSAEPADAPLIKELEDVKEAKTTPNLLVEEDIERKGSVVSFQGIPSPQMSASNSFHRQLSIANAMQKHGSFPDKTKMPRVTSAGNLRRKTSVISYVSHLDFTGSAMHIDFKGDKDEDNGLEINFNNSPEKNKKSQSWWKRLIILMDFNLLKDGIYLNILYGISIAYVADLNFKVVIPFFMSNLGYTKDETALSLSAMAISDIAARVFIPPILDRMSFPKRYYLMLGSFFLAITRSLIAAQTNTVPLITFIMLHGFFRGMTLITFPLVLSEYATNENFPSVLGLSMVAKGIFIATFGPFVGFIRDYTGSYPFCLHFQSLMIMSCVIAWGVEFTYFRKTTIKETSCQEETEKI